MQKGNTLIFLLILFLAVVSGAFYLGRSTTTPKPPQNPEVTSSPQPTTIPLPSTTSVSQECGTCGPKGLHNISGRQCATGLECKNIAAEVVTSVYFCVKPGELIDDCLKK